MTRSVDKFDTPSSLTSSAVKDCLARIADIYIFSREGPVWIILLFKQLYMDVGGYQPCRAEELL